MRASPLLGALTIVLHLCSAQAQTRSPVFEALRHGRNVSARVRAAQSIARLRPNGAREALTHALGDRSGAVRVAAVEGLAVLSDPLAVPALEGHRDDRDPAVRAALASALRDLGARGSAPMTEQHSPTRHARPRVNWRRVRAVVGVGSLTNRSGTEAAHLEDLRSALIDELAQHETLQPHPGELPATASARLRRGQLRSYTIEGSITELRSADAPGRVGARAAVSLLLLSLPQRALVGTLSSSAVAQEQLYAHSGSDAMRASLNRRAIEAAAQGALRELEQALASRR